MKKILFILFAYFCFPSFGGIEGDCQPNIDKKRDFNYITGYESRNYHLGRGAGTTITNFKYCDNLQQRFQYTPIDFVGIAAVISDTSGRLLFYTNGFTIMDSTHQIMQNGDSLCVPQYTYPNGSSVIQGGLILPKPNSNHIYYMLHHPPQMSNIYDGLRGFLITTIDMNGNNGRGRVLTKNIRRMPQDTISGIRFTACRHANGRDWWLIYPNWALTKYYRFLITPNGIDSLPPLTINRPPSAQVFSSNHTEFSPDGTMMADKLPQRGVMLYDFDRCDGRLSNRRYIPRGNYGGDVYAGLCFSPNSRYLYCTNDTSVTQYDTHAADIAASGVIVGVWDRTYTPPYNRNTKFFQPFNAPNGKIYINAPSTSIIWHTIHNPDAAGLACDLRVHDVTLPTWYYATTPNFPNFRLGALRGSPCDTLGIEESAGYACVEYVSNETVPKSLGEQIKVFPNPTSGILNVMGIENYINFDYKIYDILGRNLKSDSLSSQIAIENLKNGIYYLTIFKDDSIIETIKFIVQKE